MTNREEMETERAGRLMALDAHASKHYPAPCGRAFELLVAAVEAWPQFDMDEDTDEESCEVNGGDLVEWFGEWRQSVRALLDMHRGAL